MKPVDRLMLALRNCTEREPTGSETELAEDAEAMTALQTFAEQTQAGLVRALQERGVSDADAMMTATRQVILLVFLRGAEYGRLAERDEVRSLDEILNLLEDTP